MARCSLSSVLVPGVALIFFVFYEEGSSIAAPGLMNDKSGALVQPQTVVLNRKFKEMHDDTTRSRKTKEATGEEIEEDYPELDPAPSTKSAVKSGPIVHGTSVAPYFPISAPDHPMKGHP